MISLATIKSSVITNGKRILKVFQFGPKTAVQANPFGIDSNPLKEMVAIYADTTERGEPVILGHINKNQIANPGETRLFSLDSNGLLKASIYLKNDGSIEINGNSDNAVMFTPLKTGLQNQDGAINSELSKIATAITTLGGTYVPANILTNIDASKVDQVKIS